MKNVNAISSRDKRPLYVQAISAIRKMMESGELPIGSQLPPEGELAEMLGISRSTLREALGHLETHGLVTRQQGKGTFVSAPQGAGFLGGLERLEPFRFVAEQAKKNHEVAERIVENIQSFPRVEEDLNLEKNTDLLCIKVIEAVDDIRCMYLEDYLIADKFDSEDLDNYHGSMLTYMIETRKPPLSYSRSKIFACGASEVVAEKLRVEVGRPILQLQETYHDAVGDVLGIAYLYLVTDHFYFYVTRRVIPNY